MRTKNLCTEKRRNILHGFLILWIFIVFAKGSYATEITLNAVGSPPLNTPEQTGFLDLIAKEALTRIGYTLKTIKLPAERGLRNVNAGIEDGELFRIKGIEKLYPNLIRVPEKIIDMEFVAFSQQSINLTNSWLSLSPYSVSFLNGWKIYEKNVPAQAEITKVQNVEQLFLMLIKKRTDIILYERWGGLLYLKNKQTNTIKMLLPPLAKKEMFIYLHKKHKKLVPRLTAALKQMKQDGTYNNIVNKILTPLKK